LDDVPAIEKLFAVLERGITFGGVQVERQGNGGDKKETKKYRVFQRITTLRGF
jgi:hypothetical protein